MVLNNLAPISSDTNATGSGYLAHVELEWRAGVLHRQELEAYVEHLAREVGAKEAQIARLASSVTEREEAMRAIERRYHELERYIERLKGELATKGRYISDLEAQLTASVPPDTPVPARTDDYIVSVRDTPTPRQPDDRPLAAAQGDAPFPPGETDAHLWGGARHG